VTVRAGTTLALLLASVAASGMPAQDPDWHIPLAIPAAGAPQHPDVLRLKEVLIRYQQLAATGGWPELPAGMTLQPGQRDPRVVALRDRLRVTGEFSGTPGTADAWFFDGGLQRALGDFQSRHGLPATGVPDDRTLAALNVPAADRVQQLQATLTRWSWLPRDFGPRYLWVNVPGGSLDLIENGAPVLTMRVIAGHPDRPTPSFQDTVSQIVLNPPWSVPHTIAVEDLLPTQQEDPTFLARLGIRVLDRNDRELDPARIDWQRVSADRFPYRLRQDPGPLNSLGRLKFVLSNPWDIFLHDTPSRRLFDLNSRTLSSGCIRLERPEELVGKIGVRLVFPGIANQSVSVNTSLTPIFPTRTVTIPDPIPLYVVYLTSWVTPEGVVNFRPDVYGRDARLR
jgi:murein L,D-transpeptidase YcbB/YkuD